MRTLSILPFLAVVFLSLARGAPIDDLASPDQSIRDRAAKELLTTFQETPGTKWTALIGKIEKDHTRDEIQEILRPFNVVEEADSESGLSHSKSYRLDDEWILICSFQNDGDLLIDCKLAPSLKHIWVPPAENYTGAWVVYFVNGHKSRQLNYREGKYFGSYVAYHPDGSMFFSGYLTADGETRFYPSGDLSYHTLRSLLATFAPSEESKKKYFTEEKLAEIAQKSQVIIRGKVIEHCVYYYFKEKKVTLEEGKRALASQSDSQNYTPLIAETVATIQITKVLKGPIAGEQIVFRWKDIAMTGCPHIPMKAPFLDGIWCTLSDTDDIAQHPTGWLYPRLQENPQIEWLNPRLQERILGVVQNGKFPL